MKIYTQILIICLCLIISCGMPIRNYVIKTSQAITLFNHIDFTNFYPWLAETGYNDYDSVFKIIRDNNGENLIRISGQHLGGLITKSAFRNYKLVAEFKWGKQTWGTRIRKARDAGILLHCQGEDGNNLENFKSPWLRSIEYQIIEGGTGDLLLVSGYERGSRLLIKPKATISVMPGKRVWNKEGVSTVFEENRVDCFYRDPLWKDELGFRGENDVEEPLGKWNRIEIIVKNKTLIYYLNGIKVNEASYTSFTSGKILFQSEYAEIFFRRIDLFPL